MVDFDNINAPTPTRSHEKVSLPEMREQTQLVRSRGGRPDSKVSLRSYALSLSRVRGRHYRDAIRCACSGYNTTCGGHEDSQMPDGSSQPLSEKHTYWGDCGENWIKRKRNGIACRDADGQRVARTGRGEKRAVRWVDMEVDSNGSNIIESRQRSR